MCPLHFGDLFFLFLGTNALNQVSPLQWKIELLCCFYNLIVNSTEETERKMSLEA